MEYLLSNLETHWLALALLVVGLGLGGIALWRRRQKGASWFDWLVMAGSLVLLGAGGLGLAESFDLSVWLAAIAVTVLLVLLGIVIVSGNWSALLGYLCGAALCIAVGGLIVPTVQGWLNAFGIFALSLTPLQPMWLLLLLILPFIVWLSFQSLSGLGRTRRVLVIGLRCLAVAALVLALTEAHARRQSNTLTVLFLWDQSLSIPPELDANNRIDRRRERIFKFLNDSVNEHGQGPHSDQVGLIVFGRWPRLEWPPERIDSWHLKKTTSNIDGSYTDIGAAIKLALASFPEGTNKRIILLSDGNENLGNALEQAQLAKQNGVQIDVVPLAVKRAENEEVVVLGIATLPTTTKDAPLLLHVSVRSYGAAPAEGVLTLTRASLVAVGKSGQDKYAFETVQLGKPMVVTLHLGLNPFTFEAPPPAKGESYIYQVKFTPKEGTLLTDRVENNIATTQVLARGHRQVLLVEPKSGDHRDMVKRVTKAKPSLKFVSIEPEGLPSDPDELALMLSRFDSVILANVPKEKFSKAQEKVFHSNTHDQGCGLIMIGGPNSFGAGGWQNTDVEKALPVTCDLKSAQVEGKGGLVLIMHASEIAEGVFWQKKVAQLAVEKLSPVDMIGVLYFDHFGPDGHKWHIPFKQIGPNRGEILNLINDMNPGDMPDLEPSLKKAYDELTKPEYQLAAKHIIFISDGDHWPAPLALLQRVRAAKITMTTVCITSHGQLEYQKMADVAALTGGRSYPEPEIGADKSKIYRPLDPQALPQIYIKESRLVSKSFLYQKPFLPLLVKGTGPAVGLPADNMRLLQGCVLTMKRESPLVDVPIWTPKIGKETFPLLAYWHYGLGKSVAFTSDARTVAGAMEKYWDYDWATQWDRYNQFWEQVIEWSLRDVESGTNLVTTTELKDGKIKIIVKTQDDNKVPVTDVDLEAGITSPALHGGASRPKVKFEQTRPGQFEAEIQAEEVGSYLVNVKAKWKDAKGEWHTDGARAGVTIAYSPEFAEMNSNLDLLRRLAEITGGNVYADSSEFLDEVATNGDIFRPAPTVNVNLLPIWPRLVFLAGLCLLLDVALRRLAFSPEKIMVAAQTFWARLRGSQLATVSGPQLVDRLQSRKRQIGAELEKASRRYEGGDTAATPPPGAADMPAGPALPGERRPPSGAPTLAPQHEAEPTDYASRLKRAKQKIWKERDKEK
jgi:uncharacterized membrane protein